MSKKVPKNLSAPQSLELTNCKICFEPINARAMKCIKCGSYQDWTRHLLRWSALILSLFALAPFWSISSSLSQLAFSKKTAKIEAVITACYQNSVRLVFENAGEISGIVTGLTFTLLQDGNRVTPNFEIRNSEGKEDLIISPKQPPVSVIYRPYIDNTPASFISGPKTDKNCFYEFEIGWIDFAGSQKYMTRKCRCP